GRGAVSAPARRPGIAQGSGLWRAGLPHLGRSAGRSRPRPPARDAGATRARSRLMNLSPRARDRLIGLLSPAVLLLLWEGLARLGWIDQRFFPAPSSILVGFIHLARSGELWVNLSASLTRLFWGYLLGGVPALALGLAMGLYRPVRAIVDPLVATTYPVPKSAILPLVLLI